MTPDQAADQHRLTRCPACQTTFRVTAQQLQLRDGQVRCGRCLSVFNAQEHRIVQDAAPGPGLDPAAAHAPAGGADTEPALQAATVPDDPSYTVQAEDIAPGMEAIPSFLQEPDPLSAVAQGRQDGQPGNAESGSDAAGPTQPDQAGTSLAGPADDPAQHGPSATTQETGLQLAVTAAPDTPPPAGHLPQQPAPVATGVAGTGLASAWGYSHEQQHRPRRHLPRWLGHGLWLVLVLLMAAQAVFHYRGDLALLFPQYRPALADACAALGCILPLPQRTDLMSIESSELQTDSTNAGFMVLNVTLRNKAPFPQQPPALELTLTDTQEQAVARRVIRAREYLPHALPGPGNGQVVADLFPAGAELALRIRFDAATVPASGYRLYLFHP